MTTDQDEIFEIKESLKIRFYLFIIFFIIILFMISWLTFFLISSGDPDVWLFLVYIWAATSITISIILFQIRGFIKTRTFIITDEKIEISVPHRPKFQIYWSEINSIEIKKKKIFRPRSLKFYDIIFINSNTSQIFEYASGRHFKEISSDRILIALEKWCQKQKKSFSMISENAPSGN